MRAGKCVVVSILLGLGGIALWWSDRGGDMEPRPGADPRVARPKQADGAVLDTSPVALVDAPIEGRSPGSGTALVTGSVRMSDGRPCGPGHVFAVPVGLVAGPEAFLRALGPPGEGGVRAAPIGADGSFELIDLDPGLAYTLTAVAPGAVCAVRPTGIRVGRTDVALRLQYLHGVAIALEDARGGAPRTAPAFFGRGPHASGPAAKLLANPPELAALGIAGLEPGDGTRDRWQYLVLADRAEETPGPLEYRVQVPGYAPVSTLVQVHPVRQRLLEERIVLRPVAERWVEVAVELQGAPHVRDIGLPDDELVGTVRLTRAGDEPWDERLVEFAVHARALRAPEAIGALPASEYEAVFAAEDSTYESTSLALDALAGRHELRFDLADAGLLWVEVRAAGTTHAGRCELRVEREGGTHFYATFDRGPHVVPFLWPGRYRLTEVVVPGCGAAQASREPIEVFAGQLTLESVPCAAPGSGEGVR